MTEWIDITTVGDLEEDNRVFLNARTSETKTVDFWEYDEKGDEMLEAK